jgi:hypothetical protein
MGMGEFLYLQAGVGMGVGKILSGGYGCGWAIPNGFVPIARRCRAFATAPAPAPALAPAPAAPPHPS